MSSSLYQEKRQKLKAIATPKQATIALIIPTTSRGLLSDNIEATPLINIMLNSFANSILAEEAENYAFRFFIGYDHDDSFYLNSKNRKLLSYAFRKALRGLDVRIEFCCFQNPTHSPVLSWNYLFDRAYQVGCHYFYQIGDDITFVSQGWASIFVKTFKNYLPDGCGLTGAQDLNNPQLMTQAFVSRKHKEIFGSLYPSDFKNWYSDDWIFYTYQNANLCQWNRNVLIKNSGGAERYSIDTAAKNILEAELQKAAEILKNKGYSKAFLMP